MKRVQVLGYGLLALQLISAPSAVARNIDSDQSAPQKISPPEIQAEVIHVVGSKHGSSAVEGVTPPISLDRLELEHSMPEVLTDALEQLPALHLQTTTAGQGSPFVRGLTGSSLLGLVDGMRLNNAIYRAAPTPYMALIDPGIVDRIELTRGPASVRHGSDAMGGVIRIITRRPRFSADTWENRATLTGFFNSADLARGIRTEVAGGKEDFGIRAGFSNLETGNRRAGGNGGYQEPSSFRTFSADLAVLWEPNENHQLDLDLQFNRQPESPRYDEMTRGYGQTEPSSAEFYYEPLERLFAHLKYSVHDPAPGWEEFRFDVSYQRIRDDRRTRDYDSPTRILEKNSSQLVGVSTRVRRRIFDSVHLNWGADAYIDRVSSSRNETDITDGSRSWVMARFPDDSRMNSYGSYADLTLALLPWLTLDTGVRYSFFDTRITATATTEKKHIEISDLTGAVGFTLKLHSDLKLFVHFRRGFRAPNIFDLGTLGARPGNRFNLPTTDVDPEVIYTADFGIQYASERLEAEFTGFYSHYDEKIESILTGEQTADNRDIVQSANTGEVHLAGLESFGSLELRENLSLAYSFLWIWGEQSTPGGGFEAANRIPPIQGRVALGWQARENLLIEGYLRFAGSQNRLSGRDLRDPRIDPNGTKGWATLNLRGHWRRNDRISIVMELRNLTNANYREHGSGIQAQGAGVTSSIRIEF